MENTLEIIEVSNELDLIETIVAITEIAQQGPPGGGGGGGSGTTTTLGALINGATEKVTPVNADMLPLMDSAASNIVKKLSWANVKATLKTYFDTLYQPLAAVLTATTAAFTTAQETKLAGIATGATANSSDATLLARANHTGTQAAATISDFSTAADARAAAAIATHFPTQTAGGVLFANGDAILVQDNATFFYDNTNNTLRLLESAYNVAAAGWNSSSPSALQIGNNNTPHTFGSNPGFFGQKIDIYGAASSGDFKQLSGIRVRAQFAATGTSNGHTTTAIEAFVSNPDDTTANANALLQCLEGIVKVPKTIGRAAAGYFVVNAGGAANPTVTTQYGVFSQIGNAGAFSTTDAILFNGWAATGSGVVTNLYGLRLAGWSGTGVVNSYGIYIEASIDLGTTLKYAFYSLSTSPSLFSGPVSGVINAYDATAWNGSAKFATEDAIRDKIEALVTAIAALAADSAVVHNTGNETVAGIKTFSSSPIVPAPTTDLQAATKKYVDDAVTAGGGYTDESAQDAAAALFTPDDGDVDYTYNDATPSITSTIKAAAVSLAKMASVATGTIFYRKTAGTGDPEVQTLATLKTDLGLTGTNSGDQDLSPYFNKSADDTDDITVGATNKFATAAEKTKLGHITVTQAVDLDDIETRVNNLDAAVVLKGTWDASAGTFPGGGTAQAGASYIVSVGGTVDGVVFAVGDRVIAILDNASTTTFASNWFKADYTDQVLSVNGSTGAVTISTITGNAGTATALQNARTIGGVSFDGTSNITVSTATGGFTVSGGNLALGTNSITMSGSIGVTGTRVTKGWFTDGEFTNLPTVAGATLKSALALVKSDVGLSNVDNTSNATERAAAAALTNKTLIDATNVIEEITTTASSSTPTPTGGSLRNFFTVTALAADATVAAPSGTPVNGNQLIMRIKDDGTARALAFNAIFRAIGVTMPTTTVISKTMYIGCKYNSADSKWDVLAYGIEA